MPGQYRGGQQGGSYYGYNDGYDKYDYAYYDNRRYPARQTGAGRGYNRRNYNNSYGSPQRRGYQSRGYPPNDNTNRNYYGQAQQAQPPLPPQNNRSYNNGGNRSYYQSRNQNYYNRPPNNSQNRGGNPRYNNNNYYYNTNSSKQQYRSRNNNTSANDPSLKIKDDHFDYDDANWMEKIKQPDEDIRHKTADVTKTKGSKFSDFSINKRLLRGILEIGFMAPSPVQEESIPNILMGNNVLCRAKNGTGKTGAYCIPVLQLIDTSLPHIQGLILVPTRELALQTSRFIRQISKYLLQLNVICSTGGTSLKEDMIRFKQRAVHLVVATPGRLLDLASHGHARLGKCNLIVMDEADKLLSEDFVGLIDKILGYIPKKSRQLLLYSATFPSSISAFVDKNMSTSGKKKKKKVKTKKTKVVKKMVKPKKMVKKKVTKKVKKKSEDGDNDDTEEVEVEEEIEVEVTDEDAPEEEVEVEVTDDEANDNEDGNAEAEEEEEEEEEEDAQKTVYLNLMDDLTLQGITQFYAYVREPQKVHCLFTLIKKLQVNQCIIFCRSMNRVELLARKITKLGFSCFYIHSKMSQNDRNRVFHQFTASESKSKCRFLICTDLITRGIDVKQVNVVINFDFPKAAETYLHRIGRAGRFGHLAIAINFVTDDDRKALYQIEDDLETEIKPIPPDVEKIDKALYCQ